MSQASRGLVGRIAAAAISLLVLTYILSIATGVALVITQLATPLRSVRLGFFTGAFLIYPVSTLPVDWLFVSDCCLVVYGACLVVAFRSRSGFLSDLSRLRRSGRITFVSNWLVAMPILSSGLIILVLIATALLSRIGAPSGVPCNPLPDCILGARAFAILAYSPVGEEIAFRITPLGLLVALRTLWKRRSFQNGAKPSITSLIGFSFASPEAAKLTVGLPNAARSGWRSFHWSEWVLIVVTASIFGLAHILGHGTSWEPGKAVTAAISGLALGIVFVGYGAYAAILLHWFFDFYFETLEVAANVFGGVFAIVSGLVFIATLFVGALSILVFVMQLFGKKPHEGTQMTQNTVPANA